MGTASQELHDPPDRELKRRLFNRCRLRSGQANLAFTCPCGGTNPLWSRQAMAIVGCILRALVFRVLALALALAFARSAIGVAAICIANAAELSCQC